MITNNLNISDSSISFIASMVIIYAIVIGAISLTLYLFNAFGIYKMSSNNGFKNPWIAFIPVANSFAFGRLAEKYQKRDGSKSAKFSIILLILNIVVFILSIIMIVLYISFIFNLISTVKTGNMSEEEIASTIITAMIPVISFGLIVSVVGITYTVFHYISLWRIFSSFDYPNATLFTVLSIFFSFLGPIFLFIIRNKPATFEYKQRMEIYTRNY